MARPSVAIRLATEGKAQVRNDFAEIAQAGDATTKRLVANYEEQARAAEAAAERAARTAAKIVAVAPASSLNLSQQLDRSFGTDRNAEGNAQRSAIALRSVIAEEERLEQRTRALLSAIDPVWAAQDRFNREMAEAKALLDAGRLSTDQYAQAERRAKEALDDTTKASARAAEMSNQARFGYRQIQYQISDVASQLAMGTSAFVIFAQQAPDFAFAMQQISDGSKGAGAAVEAAAGTSTAAARATESLRSAAQSAVTPIVGVAAAAAAEAEALSVASGAATADTTALGANTRAQTTNAAAAGATAAAETLRAGATAGATTATAAGTAALTGMAAAKARLVAFITGPYGAAVMGGVTLLGILATKMDWTSDAVAKATEELKKHAKEADATREAQERWRYTIEGLIEASRKLEEQTEHLNESSREAAKRAIAEAGATLQLTLNKREAAKATLEQAKAELAWRDARSRDPDSGPGAAMAAAWSETKIREIEAQIRDLDTAIGTDKAAIAELEIAKARREAGAATDSARKANEDYADSIDRIVYAYRRSGKSAADYKSMVDGLAAAEREHKRALDAARASERDPAQTRFAAPLSSMEVLHAFGERRGRETHAGVDLRAPVGSMVRADAPGIARRKNDPDGFGYYVEIDHGRGVKSRFAHLQRYLIADGARVEQGDPIGLSGGAKGMAGAGNSSGPHLHYEVRKGGRAVNPLGGNFGIDPLGASSGGLSHEENLRRQVEAMEASTKGALALAEAYLTSGEAAVRAEAQREGATDAIRRGTEAEDQIRRQLNLDVAEGAAQGAKAVAQMRDETGARRAVNDNVSSGAIAVADMNRVLGEEAALRPLLKLQALAQGDALATLTKVIDAYRKALADAHDEEARGEALAAIDAAGKRIEDIRASIALVGAPHAREIEEARRAAIREADAKGLKPTDIERTDLIDARVDETRAQQDLRRAEFIADANRNHEDSIALLERELDLRGQGEQARQRSLKLLELELQLNRELGPEHEEQIRDLLRKAEAEEVLRAEVDKVRESLDEARQIGEDFVDTVFDPRNWKDWGDLGKRILEELAEDFIRLAILNPIKNEAFGQNNPTLSSVFAAFGNILGGASGSGTGLSGAEGAGFWDSVGASIGGNAMGTEYWRGGLTEVGENGKELLELPRGSKIKPAAETRRLLAANDSAMVIRPTWQIDARGADSAAIMRLERMMTDYSEQFGENVIAAVNDGIARRMIVGG